MSEPGNPMSEKDDAMQAVVISHLIAEHPVPLSRSDLLRELGHPQFRTSQDEIEIAVRDLARLGLLEEDGDRVRPSRAAFRYHELAEYMSGP